ncbi:MAG: hypothetical protein FWE91_10790 [Defluviitaleaceae bacterium]|nr:hypothetical protein [Defluviitaleaceae bacterium]MCL2836330.1 hypothetical protein [Defluviitaleaceae bacterium]
MKARFTAPKNGKIRYRLETAASADPDAAVYFTWASCKEFMSDIDYALNDPNVPFREDFENADERWGGLACANGGQNSQTHLAEKVEENKEWYVPKGSANVMGLDVDVPGHGLQPFNYVINGRYTLVSHENAAGEILRTMPQTMRLEADKRYRLTFNYKAYSDTEAEASKSAPFYAVEIKGKINGSDYITLHRKELENTPKKFDRYVRDYFYQENEPKCIHADITFETGGFKSMEDPEDGDIYLVFTKLAAGGAINLFLDDIKVEEAGR